MPRFSIRCNADSPWRSANDRALLQAANGEAASDKRIVKTGRIDIVNKLGLHARAASKLVKTTQSFACDIQLKRLEGGPVDAKSIMAVMMLEAVQGTPLELSCDGNDEAAAFAAIEELVAARFGEEE